MASWNVDDSVCPVEDGTGDPVCYAATNSTADAVACRQVTDLLNDDECLSVARADGAAGHACTYGAAYNGCGMNPPCDGRDGGVQGNSYCKVVDPDSCDPHPDLDGEHDFCTPEGDASAGDGRRLLAELAPAFDGQSSVPSANESSL